MRASFTLALCLCATATFAQQDITAATATESSPPAQLNAPIIIRRDTPLELLATREVSTADAMAGSRFKLRLNKPVIVDNATIIPVGAWAHGEVISASDAGRLGRSGKLTARLLYLEYNAVQIPIDGSISAEGGGGSSIGAAVILSGLAGLFYRGNNAKIKAGEIVNAFVAKDTSLNSTDKN